MKKIILATVCIVVVSMIAISAFAAEYDLVINSGRVMDPETKYDRIANVGIKNGTIAIITNKSIKGKETIDATGHVVAPGFIDIHAHGQNIGDYRMQEALRKMCLMPAQTLEGFVPQMKTKGRLQEGMDADIVVFDPETISDVGTYEAPNQPAVGVQSLLVNGTLVVADGKLVLDAAPGQPIRRPIKKQ
jgi:N-acyl-D-aspartate/D-glutamate deacylase